MSKIKKFLVCTMAVLMLLGLTACGKTCEECGEKIKGEGVEIDGEYYCDEECVAKAALGELLG